MTVRLYMSTDASAPVLTGQVGSLTALLDAVLVNGYGSKTAAGWTIAYSTTNKRAYKQDTTASNNSSGIHCYVDDTAPGAAGAKEARFCGFETMSAITPAGTGGFPNYAQTGIGTTGVYGALVIRKSNTADSTARAWTAIANGATFYLFIDDTSIFGAGTAMEGYFFGDVKAYRTNDQYACGIIGKQAENTIQHTGGGAMTKQYWQAFMSLCESNTYSNQQTCNSHYLARSFTGMGGSVQFGKTSDLAAHSWNSSCANWGGYIGYPGYPYNGSNNSGGSYLGNPYPNPADMGLIMCPVFVHHNLTRRGFMRGLWAPGHYQPMNHLDTYSGTGSMAGKSFIAINCPIISSWQNANNSSYGTSQVHVEFSDTWD